MLAGWVAIKDPSQKACIQITDIDQTETIHQLNIERPDVFESVVKKEGGETDHIKFGFKLFVDLANIRQVSIKIGSMVLPWFDLKVTPKRDSTLHGLTKSLKNKNFDFSYYQNFAKGQIGELYQLVKNQKVSELSEFWKKTIDSEFLELEHPEITGLATRARTSSIINWANYIVFSDKNDENFWVMVQILDLIDAIITPDAIYSFKLPVDFLSLEPSKLSEKLEKIEIKDFAECKFCGFTLNQVRPFHFFYDQLIWLYSLEHNLQSNITVHENETKFFPVGFITKQTPQDSHILAYPTIISRNAILNAETGKKTELAESGFYRSLTEDFEKSIYKYVCQQPSPLVPSSDFKLWIGICSEKRHWVEQVFGYSNIINALAKHFANILVIIDGLTARHGQRDEHPAEDVVIKSIAARIPPSQCKIISLSGCDYFTKIRHANLIDMFITDAGTASFVPLRICQKPGVLHSNKLLFTFPDQYPSSLQIIENSFIEEEEHSGACSPAQVSYHIHWQHIYNAAAKILESTQRKTLPYLSAPPEQRYIYNKTGVTHETVPPDQPSALKSIALIFEEKNEIAVAEKLIIEALKENPIDREALEKEAQYRKRLGIHIYKPNDDQLAIM